VVALLSLAGISLIRSQSLAAHNIRAASIVLFKSIAYNK